MEKPKCKICGERHWGGCSRSEIPRAAELPDFVQAGIVITSALLAPEGECASCDRRRALLTAAKKRGREKRKED